MEPVSGIDWGALETGLRGLPRRTVRIPYLKRAGVLVPLFEQDGGLHVLLTRRPETLRSHPGQVSFPGGKLQPGEEPLAGALRESWEELGIPPHQVQPLGALNDVAVTTGFCMSPWVGRIPADLELTPDPAEVARAFSVPVPDLVDPARTRFSQRPTGFLGRIYQIPYFEWGDELIWGATGKVLLELLTVLGLRPEPA